MNETARTLPHTPTAGLSSYAAIPDEDEQVASPPPIPVISEGRPKRNIILPKRLHDLLPSKPTGFHLFASLEQKPPLPPAMPQLSPSRSPSPSASPPPEPIYLETAPNEMGLYQCYKEWPTVDPTMGGGLDEVSDASTFTSHADCLTNAPESSTDPFYPFPNATIFHLFSWFYQSTSKSLSDVTSLVQTVLRAPDFDPEHLTDNFDAVKEIKVLDTIGKQQNCLPFSLSDGWHETLVTIKLPQTGVEHISEESASEFEVTGVYHQNLLDVIVSAFQSTAFLDFHLKGFKEMWDPGNNDQPERVYGEVYSSDIFLEMEDEVHLTPDPNRLETVIVPCMLYSDSTHLTNFGTAALWPIYLLFSLLSKYVRARPTSRASHHIVYMPTILDKIQDAYLKYFGWRASPAILTFLKQELVHAIWAKLISPEFMDAYINGVVIFCADNIYHRVYPCFFLYSADYPEKVLLASIKSMAEFLCPRCLVTKETASEMGTINDMKRHVKKARVDTTQQQSWIEKVHSWIYEDGNVVDGKAAAISAGMPVQLQPCAFDLPGPLVTRAESSDHWSVARALRLVTAKSLLTQWGLTLLAVYLADLYAFSKGRRQAGVSGGDIIQELNRRFRMMPTFGQGTIQRFKNNVSDLKNFAACDFEDILQCAMPCFEGLFPPKLDRLVLDLLFLFACWHANAKLQMHTESSLRVFERLTWLFGSFMRKFKREVDKIDTHEIPKEREARARRDINNMKKKGNSMSKGKISTAKLQKRFNLSTYKYHAMGDYPGVICAFGTTDSYSTQLGELEHRQVKRFYGRTNKNKTFAKQISHHDQKHRSRPMPARDGSEVLPYTDPSHHHHISPSTSSKIYLAPWLHENGSDIACNGFIRKLKDHLLSRILNSNDEFTDLHRQNLIIVDNRLYSHQILRINYTTYNARRNQDSINPCTHSDIMALSPSTQTDLDSDNNSHPYLYARVIGIFHATVRHVGLQSIPSGFRAKRLPCIGFLPGDDPQAFGFVDPNDVLHASHIMPAYVYGQTSDILPPSICRRFNENDMDWARYYVDIFADRDMFMRYCGNGVGHSNTREYTRGLWEELLDALGITTSENTSEVAESDAEEEEDDAEPGANTSELGHAPADLADSDTSDAEIDGSIEDEDSDSSWHSDDYVELNEPEEDDEFDDDGLFGYSAL
ncbi:uncharacterized protein EV420DRAFT_1700868 [Desarmillaria tabescens]|uniref:Uncharacterized protein n=1 Tax=Armillaria tabescens TaxID=1929756 RepID=A0AA39K1H6_ARMTA|nr:uncharacterized protein EV420DRAFT_1700868 [Desarmillaria tabescens]KAK0452774.1 hypothetical protein EV420DRAFT_1700868 [Desarmillaria tabescens]